MKNYCVIIALLISLAGCASNLPPPPLNFSVPNVGVSHRKIEAEMKSLTVTLARPDEAKGKLPAGAQSEVPQIWENALTEALNRMAIFDDNATRKVSISVKITEIDVPYVGASINSTTSARYEVIDRGNGSIIYTQDITTDALVPMGYAMAWETRSRESLNRAAQKNIAQFLDALQALDINKPMFPTRQNSSPATP